MNKVIRNGLLGAALVGGVGYVNGMNDFKVEPGAFTGNIQIIKAMPKTEEGGNKAFSGAMKLIENKRIAEQKEAEEQAKKLQEEEEKVKEEEEKLLKSGSFAEYMKNGAAEEVWYKEPVALKVEMPSVKVVNNEGKVELAGKYEYKNKIATLISELLFVESEAGETADLKCDDVVRIMADEVPTFVKVLENDMVSAYVNLSKEEINVVVDAFLENEEITYESDVDDVCKTFAADAWYDAEGKLIVNGKECKARLLDIANKSLKKCFKNINTTGVTLKDYAEFLWGVNDLEGVKFCFSEEVKCPALSGAVKEKVEKTVAEKTNEALENTKKILAQETGSQLEKVITELIGNGASSGELELLYNDVVQNLGKVEKMEDISGVIAAAVEKNVKSKKEVKKELVVPVIKKETRKKPGTIEHENVKQQNERKEVKKKGGNDSSAKTITRAEYNKLGPSEKKKKDKQVSAGLLKIVEK